MILLSILNIVMNVNSMIVDNFDKIEPLLYFEPGGRTLILVWVVSRHKDGNTTVKGSNRVRTIKSYHFQSKEHFLEKKDEIKTLCDTFNCRAYICLNTKPLLKTLFKLQEIIQDNIQGLMSSKQIISLRGTIDSAIMKSEGIKGHKFWLIDVDTKDEGVLNKVLQEINSAQSGFENPVEAVIDTVNGRHVITRPFDRRVLTSSDVVSLQTQCLALLYCNI